MSIKVRAKGKGGFYGLLKREPGDEFIVNEPEKFSKRWMVLLEDPEKLLEKHLKDNGEEPVAVGDVNADEEKKDKKGSKGGKGAAGAKDKKDKKKDKAGQESGGGASADSSGGSGSGAQA